MRVLHFKLETAIVLIRKSKELIIKSSITFFAWVLLTIIFFYYGKTNGINSDGVSNILEAISILAGNIILHGWTLPADTFYTLDTQIDTILISLRVSLISVYYLTPAVIYSLLLIVVYGIIKKISNSNTSALLSVLIFFSINSTFYRTLVLFSPIHMMTIMFVLVVYYLYYESKKLGAILFGSLLLYLAVIGDPYSIFIGTASIVSYSAFRYFRNSEEIKIEKNRHLKLIYSAAIATFLARLTVYLIGVYGGYQVVSNQFRFISLDKFSHNFYLLILGLLEVTQSNFFGRQVFFASTLLCILHLSFIAIAIYSIIKYKIGKNSIIDLCIVAIIITCLAFVFSTEPINIETSRYLLDVPILFSVIYGSSLILKRNKYILFLSIFSAAIFVIYFFIHMIEEKPASFNEYENVINILERKNLTYGYAGYWNAAPFTLLSNDNIKVRQVINSNGKIIPFAWLSNSDWYSSLRRPQFFIIGKSGNFGLTVGSVTRNFGPYNKLKIIGNFKVIIYKD